MSKHKHRFVGLVATLVALGTAGALVAYSGIYNVAAVTQHYGPTYRLFEFGLMRSVKRHAAGIEAPPLDDPQLVARGLVRFRENCVLCHGAPGVAPAPFALGMTPVPGNLAHTAREWTPAEMFWVTKHGIKMAGMPAWQFRLSDDDIWAVVAFLRRLPSISALQYRALPDTADPAVPHPQGPLDVARGKRALSQYICVTCHVIPGVVGPNTPVGPTLEGIASRSTIAGRLPNTPENMQRWLREPQRIKPASAMPALGVTERDARDMAAYLQTLK